MTTRANLESTNGKPKPDDKKVEHDFLAVGIGASAGGKRAGELLGGTEKHFRTLFELGPVAIFSCDLAGVVQDYNRRAAEIWGREPKRGDPSEKYCGSFNLYHPDGRLLPHDESPIVEVLRAGVAVGGVEVFIERPDGTRVPVIVNFEPLIDEHGAVTGAITSFLDITERKHAEETLRASEELNTAIISSLSAQIAVLDSDGNIMAVNQAWREFARQNNGKSDRCGVGVNYLQICRDGVGDFTENASEAMSGIAAVLTGELPFFSLEYPCHSPNERRWFLLNVTPLRSERGGAVISHQDITRRKKDEEELRESEERFRLMADAAPVLIWLSGTDKLCVWFNKTWLNFTGRSMDEEIGNGWTDNVHPDDFDRCLQTYNEAFDARKSFSMEYRLKCHDGEYRRILDVGVPRYAAEHEFNGYIGSCTDVTEIKQAEVAMRQSDAFNRSIIQSSPDCIKVLDLEGNLLSMEAGQELLCIDDITPFLNKSWTELWHGIDREAAQAAVEAAVAGGSGNFVGFFRNMRDEPKWWNVAISPILDADGNPVRLLAVSRDVTEQKEADEALRKHEWRLRYATESARLTFVEIDLIGGGALTPENFAAVMGYPPPAGQEEDASVGSRVLLEHVVPDDRPRVEAALREFFDGKSIGNIDYRVLGDDRIERWIDTRWSMELSPDGKPLRSFATNLDITERKQAEEALRNSEERYRNLFDSMDEGYCTIEMIFDEHGKPVDYRYLEINPSFEKLTGMHDALGKRISEFVPDLEEYWFEVYGNVALTGEPIRVANEVKGMNRWFDIYAFRIGGNDSREVAILFRNITESKQAERQTEMLSNLSRELAGATEETEIVEIAVEAVGRHLNGHRCYFVECLADENRLLVSHNWVRDEAPSIEGELSLFDFGGIEWWREFASGDFIMEDVATNPLTQAKSASYHAVGVPSYAVQPFRRDADWTVCLVVTEKSPRKWTAYDLRVLADVVARVWPLVERARADLELRESEAQLSLALDAAELGTFNIDPATNTLKADERFHAIFGIADEQSNYEQAFAVVHPDDRDQQRIEVAAAIRPDNPSPYNTEYRVIHPDGSIHWVSAKARVNFGQNGSVQKLLSFDGTVADITERKQLEANLKFLADIGQDLARITTVEETMRTIGAKMGAYLDLSLCTFIEINEAEDHATVNYDWHRDDVPSVVGVHRISDFMTEEFQAAGRAGETFIVRDVATDERATAERFAAFKIASMVSVPIIKDGEWQFLLCIYRSEASDWREDEIALTQELAVRIWTRLESARAVTALHKSEQLLRSIYDGAQEYIGLLDPDGIMLDINRAALEFDGTKLDEVVGLPFWEAIWFKNTPGAPEMVRQAISLAAAGEIGRYELSVNKPTGETMTFDFSLYPIRDELGEVIFILPEGRDITTRKQAEDSLRESEENFRNLADNMSQLAWTTDQNGWIFWYNSRWFDYTGTTLDEMQGWGWQKVLHPDELERVVENFKRNIASGESWEDTFPLRSKTGEYRWFLTRARPIRDENGNIVRWFGTNTDVEDVRRAEMAVLKREEEFRALADASPGLIWRLDADGNTTYVNRRYRRFFGTTTAQVLEKGWLPLLHPEDADGYMAAIADAQKEQKPLRAGARVKDKTGAWAWLESHATPVFDAESGYAGFVGISLDMTDQKLLEEQLRRSQEDLESRVEERTVQLAEKNEELQNESEKRLRVERDRIRLLHQIVTIQEDERRRIARDMHDELGQQVTALRLKLENAKEICSEEPVCDEIDATQAIAERLDADIGFLAWELRPAALLDSGLPATLAGYVKEWSRFASVDAEMHSIGFGKTRLSSDVEINLYRIVQEALNNAYKYAQAKDISILLEKNKSGVSLIIEDDGVGFDPSGKPKSKSGLGLVGMRERASLLGGTLEIESSEGTGTTIFVRIPEILNAKPQRRKAAKE